MFTRSWITSTNRDRIDCQACGIHVIFTYFYRVSKYLHSFSIFSMLNDQKMEMSKQLGTTGSCSTLKLWLNHLKAKNQNAKWCAVVLLKIRGSERPLKRKQKCNYGMPEATGTTELKPTPAHHNWSSSFRVSFLASQTSEDIGTTCQQITGPPNGWHAGISIGGWTGHCTPLCLRGNFHGNLMAKHFASSIYLVLST